MADYDLLTYQDALDHLRDAGGGAARSAEETRTARRAVQLAHKSLMSIRSWRYLRTFLPLQFNAPYSTGTIEYDHTGHASGERIVTLTDGTWPTWAGNGTLVIENVTYWASQRISDSLLQLHESLSPQADIDADTAYSLYQDTYTLPSDFKQMSTPQSANDPFWALYVSPEEWMARGRSQQGSGGIVAWTIAADPRNTARLALLTYPYPDTAERHDCWYDRLARPLIYSGYGSADRDGTVTVSGTTATFSASTKKSGMVGSVLRIGDTTNYPEGRDGINVYAEQIELDSFTSATVLRLKSAVGATHTAVKYAITDPIDVPPTMHNAFLSLCEVKYAELKKQDAMKPMSAYLRELSIAKSAGSPTSTPRSAWDYRTQYRRRWSDGPRVDQE